jgi:hypothetical protein
MYEIFFTASSNRAYRKLPARLSIKRPLAKEADSLNPCPNAAV